MIVDRGVSALHLAVVWAGDWICLGCQVRNLACQADHVRPRHAGGPDVLANLAPLCPACNQVKSCWWPGHGYHPLPGRDDAEEARRITFAELEWLAGHHGQAEVDGLLWGAAGEPGPWSWREPAAGPWLAAWS